MRIGIGIRRLSLGALQPLGIRLSSTETSKDTSQPSTATPSPAASGASMEQKNKEAIAAIVRRMGLLKQDIQTLDNQFGGHSAHLARKDKENQLAVAQIENHEKRLSTLEKTVATLHHSVSEVLLGQKALAAALRQCEEKISVATGGTLAVPAAPPKKQLNQEAEPMEKKIEILSEQVAMLKSAFFTKSHFAGDALRGKSLDGSLVKMAGSVMDVIERGTDAAIVDCDGALRVCSCQVEVLGLPDWTSAAAVRAWIRGAGPVASCLVRHTSRGRSFAVTFETVVDAVRAVETLNGTSFGGVLVHVVPLVAAQIEAALVPAREEATHTQEPTPTTAPQTAAFVASAPSPAAPASPNAESKSLGRIFLSIPKKTQAAAVNSAASRSFPLGAVGSAAAANVVRSSEQQSDQDSDDALLSLLDDEL